MADPAAYLRVYDAVAALWDAELAALRDFCPSPLPARDCTAPEPLAMPVLDHLETAREASSPGFQPLTDAILDGAQSFEWVRTYRDDQGLGDDFMAKYGWFNLVSPEGPFLSTDMRIAVAFWGADLSYPEHWHEPEELYAVIAGGAEFRAEGRAPVQARVGDMIHHRPNQPHAIEMTPGPLLAVVGWKGGALMRASTLESEA